MSEENGNGVASLPAIATMAQSYELTAKAFVNTFRSMAMPEKHTAEEFVSCCLVAKEHGLNPLTKEIYFMKTKGGQIQPIVSVDGWIRKCNEHPQFDGMEFLDDRDDKGNLTGMFCTIYRKDRAHPTKIREDLADCKKSGGPVWNSSEYRMMRNRVLCQCARIAFGFAGVMERDEFESWQGGMKDVTPLANDIPELPEIPDLPDIPEDEDEGHEGFLAMLRHKAAEGDRDEVWKTHEEMIGELPEAIREKAVAIFEDA